jgi:hypothetical protein
MRKITLSLAFAASAVTMASMQAEGSGTSSLKTIVARDARACQVLVQKMERSPSANNWLNRMRTWKCRDDLSPDTPDTAALLQEMDR